jgi:hypothetical protein
LKGLNISGLFGRAWRRRRAKGKSFVQSKWSTREFSESIFECAIGTLNLAWRIGGGRGCEISSGCLRLVPVFEK